ncbi:hypothetical protein E1B28_000736 [Marasmius oreades]|uniref:VanZ-like domain-containing protein n=1 Tax=Marasmius oreades TaxID=181124 RepID=A0A9P8AEN4_9AGAR|nr:uncharacterized protein E1B28_000736 [Marasmius oreades]KAG7098832.1 hypothetical protein E1B28_000736 [Marasmius oreades]
MASDVRRFFSRVARAVMKSYHVRLLNYHHDNPLRIRPWFVLFTTMTMLSLALLGFTNFHEALPLSDKLLRFICFWVATFVFYFIVDVDEHARRVWLWRNSGMILTVFTCLFCGGILSEVVQSLLPFKEFEFGDVAANLLGSTIGLYSAFHLERYYRHRREIARLYRPLDTDEPISETDEDLDADDELVLSGTQLLPLYRTRGATSTEASPAQAVGSSKGNKDQTKLQNVWDEREELFGIGDDEEDDNSGGVPLSKHGNT